MRHRALLSSLALAAALAPLALFAWTGPTATAPNGNVPAPINVGTTDQVKNAGLGVNALAVFGNSILQGGSYLNWGATPGSSGYGIWDNAGVLNFKNSGGSWQSLQAIVAGLVGNGSQWVTNGTSIYYNGGNVGINTATPGQRLDVNGFIQVDSINNEGGTIKLMGNNGTNMFVENNNGTFRLVNSPWTAELFHVDQSGNTSVIGTLSVGGALGASNVYSGAWYFSGGYPAMVHNGNYTEISDPTAGSYGSIYLGNASDPTAYIRATTIYLQNSAGTANYAYANSSGLTAPAFYYSSDRRLKQNIQNIPNDTALADVLALQPVTYNWKDISKGAGTQVGFIAQQVQQVVPELVATDAHTTMESVDYAKVTPLLVGAAQAQQQMIDAQQKEIDQLKAQVAQLEGAK